MGEFKATGDPLELMDTMEADDGMRVSWFWKASDTHYVVWTYPGSYSPQMEAFDDSNAAKRAFDLTVENWA